LGMLSVSGLSLVPKPAAKIIACIILVLFVFYLCCKFSDIFSLGKGFAMPFRCLWKVYSVTS